MGHVLVAAVDGQGVLDQVIGADGEKIDLGSEQVRDDHRTRHLDHHPEFDFRGVGQPVGIEGSGGLADTFPGLLQFGQGADERQQDAQPAVHRGPQQGAQLGMEQGLFVEREADGAQAERRVGLPVDPGRGPGQEVAALVAAHVQGAHGHRMGGRIGQQTGAGGHQLLLGGRPLPLQIDELAAEQADALTAVVEHGRQFLEPLDVGAQAHRVAVHGLGDEVQVAVEFAGHGLAPLFLLAAVPDRLRVRVEHDHAAAAVQDHQVAARQDRGDAIESGHGRQAERAGDNGRVRGHAPLFGAKAEHVAGLHAHGVFGGKIVGHEDGRSGRLIRRVAGAAGEQVEHPVRHLADVAVALADVGVVDLLEPLADVGEGPGQGPFRVDLLAPDDGHGTLVDHPVLEHEQVAIDDRQGVGQVGGQPFAQHRQFATGSDHRLEEPLDLDLDLVGGQLGAAGPPGGALADQHPADDDPRRDADPLEGARSAIRLSGRGPHLRGRPDG